MEKIIEKLQKLKTLSERGEWGEAVNAKRMLEKFLCKYNLTLDDLSSEIPKKRVFKANFDDGSMAVLFMCACKILELKKVKSLYQRPNERNKVYAELTDLEYAEMTQFYDFHKKNFAKERKRVLVEFEQAYQAKHDLYATRNDDDEKPKRQHSAEEIMRIVRLAQSLEDVFYHKQLKE
ncbi:hypothetical protein AGMMS49525_11940 [Bacteroidia bacterium]|nr:hypothetical protein AGMMS49525_11940 [Bacteroidia bacterium]